MGALDPQEESEIKKRPQRKQNSSAASIVSGHQRQSGNEKEGNYNEIKRTHCCQRQWSAEEQG